VSREQVVRKKVRPYPFDGELEANAQKTPIEIIYLSASGVIARLKNKAIMAVGDYRQITFEIPVSHHQVVTKARIIKTYDRSVDAKALVVERMLELHFEALTTEQKKNILSFMGAIGQK